MIVIQQFAYDVFTYVYRYIHVYTYAYACLDMCAGTWRICLVRAARAKVPPDRIEDLYQRTWSGVTEDKRAMFDCIFPRHTVVPLLPFFRRGGSFDMNYPQKGTLFFPIAF